MIIEVGKSIRNTRRSRDLSQEWLADRVGLTSASISRIENGVTIPDTTQLQQIATALGVTVIDLFSGESPTSVAYTLPLHLKQEQRDKIAAVVDKLARTPENEQNTILEIIDAYLNRKR